MRFSRRGSDSVPEMVSVDHLETPPQYLSSQPVKAQELPAHQSTYMHNQQQWPKSQATISQHDSLMGHSYPNSHNPGRHDDEKKRRKIWGMSPLIFILGLLAIVLIIVGAVVGGVLGSRSMKEKNVDPPSSTGTLIPAGSGSASSTITMTSTVSGQGTTGVNTVTSTVPPTYSTMTTSTTRSSTTTSTSTLVSIRPVASARYAGLAVDSVAVANIKLFYVDKQKGAIVGYSQRGSGWENHGSLTGLTYAPSMSNSVAVAYWLNSGKEEIRVYYISQGSKLIELVLGCPVKSACIVNAQQALGANDIADTSNLSVVQYFNAQRQPRIYVYYINKSNQVSRIVYSSRWASPSSTGYSAYPGSTVATSMVYLASYAHKTYYTRTDGTLSSIYSYEDNRTLTEYTVTNSGASSVGATANIAACDIPSSNSYNYEEGRIYRIANDNLPSEMYSRNQSSWTSARSSAWLTADYGNKDGIAATSWLDINNLPHVRLYYPDGGSIVEYCSDNWSAWYTVDFQS